MTNIPVPAGNGLSVVRSNGLFVGVDKRKFMGSFKIRCASGVVLMSAGKSFTDDTEAADPTCKAYVDISVKEATLSTTDR